MKNTTVWLLAIISFFLITRLYAISSVPKALYWDEASIGYNAYSILKTGRDEWGQFLPLQFKAFGEYKLPIYIYTTTLSEFIFGLNMLSVRLPAILFSLGTIVTSYFLAKKLFKEKLSAWLVGFYLSISPWLFIFSRTGYEATAGLFFYVLSLYLLILSLEKRKQLLPIAFLTLGITMYSYNSYRVIAPLTAILFWGAFLYTYKSRSLKQLVISLIVLTLLLLPIFFSLTSGSLSRFNQVGFYNLTESKPQNIASFIKNYLKHFSPNFLFLKGDTNMRSQIPRFGELYWVDGVLFMMTIFYCLKKRDKRLIIPVFVLLISPIPAALTKEAPHALRSLSLVLGWALLFGWGVSTMASTKRFGKVLLGIVLAIWLGSFSWYFYHFINSYPTISASDWQYQYKILFESYKNKFSSYDHVIISDVYGQPYIFFLTYLKFDPQKLQKEIQYNSSIRQYTSLVNKIDKFEFKRIDYYSFSSGRSLIFAHPSEKLSEIPYSDVMYNPDHSIAFYVYNYQK